MRKINKLADVAVYLVVGCCRLVPEVTSLQHYSMEVTLEKRDAAAFRKLDYWQQWDAMCGHAARLDTSALKLMLYFVGMALAAMNVAVVYVLTEFVFPGPSFTETFVKNLIAWTSLAYQLGFDLVYWPLATNWGPLNKWKVGTL